MKKEFNVTGLCVSSKHYMVNISEKLEQVTAMIEKNKYFTINRARQYGKTTMLSAIRKKLKDKYYVLKMSFEGLGSSFFSNESSFCCGMRRKITETLMKYDIPQNLYSVFDDESFDKETFEGLSKWITKLCENSDKEIVVLIDEVDKSSDNQIFLDFLGMLRNKYLDTADDDDLTFKSVILAGVYDIKNLKMKIRPEAEKKYNSPWNIAEKFNVDMSFSAKDISTMLADYENDYKLGININSVSERIYEYTSGYPFLVSCICKIIDEELERNWTAEGIQKAVKLLLNDGCILFDDLIKNIDRYQDLSDITEGMILRGEKYPFNINDHAINLGMTFGVFSSNDGQLKISNRIFETYLYDYYIIRKMRKDFNAGTFGEKDQFVENR